MEIVSHIDDIVAPDLNIDHRNTLQIPEGCRCGHGDCLPFRVQFRVEKTEEIDKVVSFSRTAIWNTWIVVSKEDYLARVAQ